MFSVNGFKTKINTRIIENWLNTAFRTGAIEIEARRFCHERKHKAIVWHLKWRIDNLLSTTQSSLGHLVHNFYFRQSLLAWAASINFARRLTPAGDHKWKLAKTLGIESGFV